MVEMYSKGMARRDEKGKIAQFWVGLQS